MLLMVFIQTLHIILVLMDSYIKMVILIVLG